MKYYMVVPTFPDDAPPKRLPIRFANGVEVWIMDEENEQAFFCGSIKYPDWYTGLEVKESIERLQKQYESLEV